MPGPLHSPSEPPVAGPESPVRALLRETFTFSAALVVTGALLVSIGALSAVGLVSGTLVGPRR